MTPSLKGMRRDADMAAALSRGGMDRLNGHTHQTAIACRVFTVWTLSLHTVYAMAAACGAMGFTYIARCDRSKYAYM